MAPGKASKGRAEDTISLVYFFDLLSVCLSEGLLLTSARW